MTSISFATVALVIVIAFIFRSTLKRASNTLPEVADSLLNTATKGARQLDAIVTVNCLESSAELNNRAAEVKAQIEEAGGLIDLNALYNSVNGLNTQPKTRRTANAAQSA